MNEKNYLEFKKELIMQHSIALGKQEILIRATLDTENVSTEQEIELLHLLIDTMNALKVYKKQREELENKIEIAGDENG